MKKQVAGAEGVGMVVGNRGMGRCDRIVKTMGQ
jgi:hypothetical protein